MLGYPVAEWYGKDFWIDHLHPEDRDRVIAECSGQGAVNHDFEFEYRMTAADGRAVWVHNIIHVSATRTGRCASARGFLIDVSARKRAEEMQQALLHELDHRVKNTLSTVQAVAEMTLRTCGSLETFGETFRGRLAALARMHATIWRTKGGSVPLREAGRGLAGLPSAVAASAPPSTATRCRSRCSRRERWASYCTSPRPTP